MPILKLACSSDSSVGVGYDLTEIWYLFENPLLFTITNTKLDQATYIYLIQHIRRSIELQGTCILAAILQRQHACIKLQDFIPGDEKMWIRLRVRA